MTAPILRASARGLWMRRRRLLGMVAAVFLGVAFLSGTLSLSATMSSAIDTAITTAYQGTSVIVRNATATQRSPGAPRGPISGSVLTAVRAVPGVASAEGEITGFGELEASNGKPITGLGPRTAGSWLTDPLLNPWHLVSGTPPSGPDDVVIDAGSAAKGGLRAGQRVTLLIPQPVPVTVTGIARYGTQPSDGGSSYVAFTLAGAQQHLLSGKNKLTAVVARARPGLTQAQLASAVKAAVPPGTQVITSQQAASEQIAAVNNAFLGFFQAFLGVFAGIALLVAALSIHNASDVIAAQRIRESALLRAIGASRGQVFAAYLCEAAALGLAASAAGVAAGYGMAAGLKGVFAGFGLDLPLSGVVFTWGNVVVGVVTGVAVTMVAAITGALHASRTSPLAAMRAADGGTSAASRARIAIGATAVGVGAAICVAGALNHRTPLTGFAAVLAIAGVIVAGPAIAAFTAQVPGAILTRLRGLPGSLARRNMTRAPKRAAATAAALTVGVAIVTVFTVFGASLKASAGANLDQTFTGDLVVSATAPGVMRGGGAAGFSPSTAQRIGSVPGVAAAVGTEPGTILADGASTQVTVADPALLGKVFRLGPVPPGELAVSATAAGAHGWGTGSQIQVTFPDGHRSLLRIGRIYQPINPLGGMVMPATIWAAHTAQPRDTAVYVALRPGAATAAATRRISAIATAAGAASVTDRAAYLAAAGSGVTALLGIIYVMLALAIVIALLGIGNTLSLAVHERTHEIGLLRAVGATRAQIRSTVRWEAVLTATLGTGTGAALGLFLGWALVTSVRVDAAGTPGAAGVVTIPWPQVMVILLLGVAAGLLAGVRPARRAASLDPLAALAVA